MSSTPFHIMAKPIGPECNLDCSYCYYTEKVALYPPRTQFRMTDEVLEAYIKGYIEASSLPEIMFFWQGGEPTLLGLDFFKHVVELQQKYQPNNQTVTNSLQTNGTLIDEAWAGFLAEHNFLIGISIDGPARLHDRFRVGKKNEKTFAKVEQAIKTLQAGGVEYNTLTTVQRRNYKFGAEVYHYLRDLGVEYMQFIPIVERRRPDGELAGPPELEPQNEKTKITEWSVPQAGYAEFLTAVFDVWRKTDIGKIFVQPFDVHLGLRMGEPSTLCINARSCGQGLALEHNGDLYACDHYVYESHLLGNISETPMQELATAARQLAFGEDKYNKLPGECLSCRFLTYCGGGCPKHRFMPSKGGGPDLNYFCPSYTKIAEHIEPAMSEMAALLRQGHSPARIME
ncbi:MAG: anaerobic sulfatase maturase [Rhodospirillaceae bacterium]|nr:anaerobic sulfatase maturase [Rhodospirillaceae bacterium]